MTAGLHPPYVDVGWEPLASLLGSNFGGYRIQRRPRATPARPLVTAGLILPRSAGLAAVDEVRHCKWRDYSAGWYVADGQWDGGFEWWVSAIMGSTGQETNPILANSGLQPLPDPSSRTWVVAPSFPYLSSSVIIDAIGGSESNNIAAEGQPAGRDELVRRIRAELPGRNRKITWRDVDLLGGVAATPLRAAQSLGIEMALLMPSGERLLGVLGPLTQIDYSPPGILSYATDIAETAREASMTPAGFNHPAGMFTNGSSQFLTIANAAVLNPGAGPFSVVLNAVFTKPASVVWYASKGNASSGNGWAIGHDNTVDADNLQAKVRGASSTATLNAVVPGLFDGRAHTVILESDGAVQRLIVDGVVVATNLTTTGSISNSAAVAVGANNAGADHFASLTPWHTFAMYGRAFDAAEETRATYYPFGYPGYRMPAGAAAFVDLRDSRSWDGSGPVFDLTDQGLLVNVTGSPDSQGTPWDLSLFDRFD